MTQPNYPIINSVSSENHVIGTQMQMIQMS